MFKVGDKVRFLDFLWEEKQCIGSSGMGFFSSDMSEDHENEFEVLSVKITNEEDGEEGVELQLKDFPWLVWQEELEPIDKENNET